MNINMLFDCACDEFGLPSYRNKLYKDFVAKAYFNDYKLLDYFDSPAVKCDLDEIEDVQKAVSVSIGWDQSGEKVVVYPNVKL